MSFRKMGQIREGIRVEYLKWETRKGIRIHARRKTGRVIKRIGNYLTLKTSGYGQRKRIHLKDLSGYWRPKVKASPDNKEVVGCRG